MGGAVSLKAQAMHLATVKEAVSGAPRQERMAGWFPQETFHSRQRPKVQGSAPSTSEVSGRACFHCGPDPMPLSQGAVAPRNL